MVNKKIAAVIVTYNRAQLVTRCIEGIINQNKKPDRVYIIDNASTDNTYETLYKNGYIDNIKESVEFMYIKMSSNLGGAGGFYTGLKQAFNDGYDLFWVMDDDGIPHSDCLKNLIIYADEYQFISPLVLSVEDDKILSFGINGIKDKERLLNIYSKKIDGFANPFNGVLFTRDMIGKIGFPKKEMFIWGDELEYQTRAMNLGFKVVTVLNAIHYHPEDRIEKIKILFNKIEINYPEGNLRRYCLFRNYIYILNKYYNKKHIIKWFIKYIYFFIISNHMDIKGLLLFIQASIDSFTDNFNNHKKYI